MDCLLCRVFVFKDQCSYMELKGVFGEAILSSNWKTFPKSWKTEFCAGEK